MEVSLTIFCGGRLNLMRRTSLSLIPSQVCGDSCRNSPLGSNGPTLSRSSSTPSTHSSAENPSNEPVLDATYADNCHEDIARLTTAEYDRVGLANGSVSLSESDKILREELKYEQGSEKRQKAFYRNDDLHISVTDLWEAWLRSEVQNWTIEQTTDLLASNVELPQYIPTFIHHRVTVALLPRLAVSNMQYLTSTLGIKDPILKQKIQLKAMDIVLLGPHKVLSQDVDMKPSWLTMNNSIMEDADLLSLLIKLRPPILEGSAALSTTQEKDSAPEPNGMKPQKPCNRSKSQCLKLFCPNGEFCFQWNCICCFNGLEHEEEGQRGIPMLLDQNLGKGLLVLVGRVKDEAANNLYVL